MIGPGGADASITAAIVSANQLVRLGLQTVIKDRPQIELIGQASSIDEAEELVARRAPHLLMLDMENDGHILKWATELDVSISRTKIILLTAMKDAPCTWEALSKGIDAIVLSNQPRTVLLATIDYLCQSLAKTIRSRQNGSDRREGTALGICAVGSSLRRSAETLTKREREITHLIGLGLSNKDIAGRLSISHTTVRHHLTTIFGKFGVTNRQNLLIKAHQEGLMEFKTSA